MGKTVRLKIGYVLDGKQHTNWRLYTKSQKARVYFKRRRHKKERRRLDALMEELLNEWREKDEISRYDWGDDVQTWDDYDDPSDWEIYEKNMQHDPWEGHGDYCDYNYNCYVPGDFERHDYYYT